MNHVRTNVLLYWLRSLWNKSESEHLKQQILVTHPLRWFLLVWVSLVYCGGFWDLLGAQMLDPAFSKCWTLTLHSNLPHIPPCPPLRVLIPQHLDLWPVFVFTGLILVYGIVLWCNLEHPIRRPRFSFLLQASIVFAIGLIVRQENVALSLYLCLTLAAISTFRHTRFAIVVASSSLSLFILSTLLNRGDGEDWQMMLLRAWTSTNMTALALFLMGYLILYRQEERAHAELTTTHLQLQASASRIEALTRLTERRRLARELHDTLAQGLVGLTLQLETADGLLTWGRFSQAQEIVQQAMTRARATLTDARDAIDDLRAEQEETFIFLEAVYTEIRHLTSTTGLCCHTDLELLNTLDPSLQEHMLRVLREGVTNAVRHAQARHMWIRFMQKGETHTIEVRDDGIGFDPGGEALSQGHYGLIGLRERAQFLGGHLEIASTVGKGTTIRFSFPRHAGGTKK